MKKTIFSLALLSLVASSCSDTADLINSIVNPEDKEMIRFSTNESHAPLTRAGFTGGTTYNAETKTQIVARIRSVDNSSNVRHTRTLMTADPDPAAANGTNWNSVSAVDYSGDEYKRYWDDAFGRAAHLSIYAVAVPNKTSVTNNSTALESLVDYSGTAVSTTNTKWKTGAEVNTIAWTVATTQTTTTLDNEDLCYSNNIQATAGSLGKDGRRVWNGSAYPAYSYVADPGDGDHYPTLTDGQMQFKLNDEEQQAGPGHFDYGHMIFTHALSRISVDLKIGEGFDMSNQSNFTIQPIRTASPALPSSIDLLNFNTSGTLNIQSGSWTGQSTSDETFMICGDKGTSLSTGSTAYSLTAQVVPGYTFDGTDANSMAFMIDGNAYYVTKSQILEALKANSANNGIAADASSVTMEQGKHYKFTITVGKTGIKALTCTLIDWVDVAATFAAKNAYITLDLLNQFNGSNTHECANFDLYRVLNENTTVTTPTNTAFDGTNQFMTNYSTNSMWKLSTDGASPGITNNGTTSQWKTTWFFESNKSFYHFRTVNPGVSLTTDAENGDFFTMYSGPICDDLAKGISTSALDGMTAAANYKFNDYHWGATFKSGVNLNYNVTEGFGPAYHPTSNPTGRLSLPIGPTTNVISLTEQHMMSNVKVVLLTPASGTDVVDLYDETKTGVGQRKVSELFLTKFSASATVRMGNGLITPSVGITDQMQFTTPTYTQEGTGTNASGDYCTSVTYVPTGKSSNYYKTAEYTYRVVPQTLTRGDGASNKVGITILTPDDNMYYVVEDLSTIVPSSVTGNALKGDHNTTDPITRWYPGYTYTYYFILTKTGIKALTCTIVDWVNVEAANKDITLEN